MGFSEVSVPRPDACNVTLLCLVYNHYMILSLLTCLLSPFLIVRERKALDNASDGIDYKAVW